MFNFQIKIYDYESEEYKDYTKYGVFPPKFADLLDEQLDEAEIQMRGVPVEIFQQQTPVQIVITETAENPYNAAMVSNLAARSDNTHNVDITLNDGKLTETTTINMLVATDKSFNFPRGIKNSDGKLTYNHTLYLIEETKLLERFVGEGLTFTNALGNNYTKNNRFILFTVDYDGTAEQPFASTTYKTPYPKNNVLTIQRLDVFMMEQWRGFNEYINLYTAFWGGAGVYVTDENGNNVYSQWWDGDNIIQKIGANTETVLNSASLISTYNSSTESWKDFNLTIPDSVKELNIKYTTYGPDNIDGTGWILSGTTIPVYNKYPLKKHTITDVINRCFQLIEPLNDTQEPRFVLDSTQATELEKIIAPEYAMTRMTLREQLKLIGGTIHGEPRIIGKVRDQNVKGGWKYTVAFDMYGQTIESHIKNRYCVSDEAYADINDYATELDSSVENLVSQLDWAQGVITEPFFEDGNITLRAETTNVRIEDAENGSAIIPTSLPIHSLIGQGSLIYCGQGIKNGDSITWKDAYGSSGGSRTVDITPYLFEATDYQNTLSSYAAGYPLSRAYAVYYTQGEKGIKGLFFKQEAAVAQAYKKYAIVNIIRAAGGVVDESNYSLLRFRVSYLPVVATRVKTHKSVVLKGTPSTIVYNQAANLVESKYYGENLKGVVARLGNIEKTKTFLLGHLSDIPKIGLLYDDDYYISAVRWELRPKYIVCSVGLSKDFNRLSEYVGISSTKRMWEISERQIQRRETVFNPKIVVSLKEYVEQNEYIFADPVLTLFNHQDPVNPAIFAVFKTTHSDGTQSRNFILPVSAVALGNSLAFTCNLDDNYSVGQKVEYNNAGEERIQGWWTAYSPYNDYYGRFKKLNIYIASFYDIVEDNYSLNLPENNNKVDYTPIITAENRIYDKDNREIPQFVIQLSAMSDDPKIIIGSALMSNCGLVNHNESEYQLYLSDEKISPLLSNLILSTNYELSDIQPNDPYVALNSNYIDLTIKRHFGLNNITTKSWAIVTKRTTQTITVTNEDGTDGTQTIQKGGEIVLAGNFAPATTNYSGNTESETYRLYFNVVDDLETLTENTN